MSEKIAVGQRLLVASSSRTRNGGLAKQEVVLAKVGRRWAYIEELGWKVDLRDGWVLNFAGRAIGRWYRSEEEYQSSCERERIKRETDNAWQDFSSKVISSYSVPKGVTLEAILEARAAMFGETAPPAPSERSGDATTDVEEKRW